VGFKDSARGAAFFYDRLLPFHPDVAIAEHEREALRATELPVELPYPMLSVTPEARVLEKFNVKAGNYIIVHLF